MNTPGAFGDYIYPISRHEALACGRWLLASRTGSTAWVLRHFPDLLVAPGGHLSWSASAQAFAEVYGQVLPTAQGNT